MFYFCRWFLFFVIVILSGFQGKSQFISSAGSAANDEVLNVYQSPNGAILSIGYYNQLFEVSNLQPLPFSGGDDAFILSENTAGVFNWATNISGPTSDRGLLIRADAFNNVYAAGYFRNTANCQGQSITSDSLSQDIFIAKFNSAGVLLWIKAYGGSGQEFISGLEITNTGQVFISGTFKGRTVLGTSEFQSVEFFNSGNSGFDAFLTKLDTSGNVLDANHLHSAADDELSELAIDDQQSIYITIMSTGQLSFGQQTINPGNTGYGALLKFTSIHDLVGWHTFNSSFIDLRALDIRGNKIAVGGNYATSLTTTLIGSVPMSENYANAIFGICLDTEFNVLGWFSEGSENSCDLNDIVLDNNNDLWAFGNFSCSFNSVSDRVGTGLFISLGYNDGFALKIKHNEVDSILYQQQFGSIEDDNITSAFYGLGNVPIFGGGFKQRLYYSPLTNCPDCYLASYPFEMDGTTNTFFTYCGYANYNRIRFKISVGSSDAFVSNILDPTAPILDVWRRDYSEPCNFEEQIPQIFNFSEDTVRSCENIQIKVKRIGLINGTMYQVKIHKNDVQQANWLYYYEGNTFQTNGTGLYVFEFYRPDNCKTYFDSLYFIKLDVYPDPTFSLGDIIFVPTTFESPGGCGNILLYPDSITPEVSGQVFYPTDSLTWRFLPYFTPGSWEVLAIDTPTIEVNQGGDYQYLVSGPSCGSDNCFFAVPYEMTTCIECNNGEGANLPSLPGSDSATQLVLTMNNIRGGNTISFCSNTDFSNFPITFGLYQLDQNDSLVKRIIPAFGRWDISAPAVFPKLLPTLPPTPIYHSFLEHFYSIVNVTSSGWIHVEFSVCAPPDTQNILFTIRDSFYIDLREPPNFEFIFDASTNKLCPGDTMIVHYGISEDYPFTVEAPQALSINTVNQEALFIFQGYIMMKSNFFDLNSGCQVEKVAYFNVEYKQAPQIIMNPSSGRKCPEDSILLQAQPGLETYWFGPDGDTISTSNSIYVTAPGAYYYNQIDFDQCPLLSNYREVRNITAFITDSIITSNICANQPAIIRLAPDTNLNYHWLPPLSGSDTIKYIYQPGNYAVSVELCSNLDTLRFTVSEGLENATIQLVSSPAVLCEGGIIQFATNPLATETIWYPGEVFTDTFTVSSPGFISVLVRDTLGCELTSNRVVTEYPTPPIPNFVSVEEACPGVPITITSTGNYPVRWFSLPDSVEIGSGNSISVDVLQNGQMIGAYTYNPSTQCRSEMIVQSLTLLTLVSPGFLPAERLFCKDDTLITSPQSVMGIGSGYWTGPNNWASTGDQLIIPDITPTQAGVYTYTPIADSGYCALETLNILLEERQLETPNFSFPDSLCEGQNMQLNVDQLNDYLYNWAGPSGSSNLNTWNIEDVPTGFTGKYYISSKDSNCIRVDSFTVFVSSMPPFNPILLTPDYVCNEDTLFLYNGDSLNTANAAILWGGVPSFQYLSPHAVFIPGFNFASNTVITLQYGINQCKSAVTFLSPFIVPQPEFSFFSDSIKVCKSSDFTLSAPIPGVSYRWNTGSNLPSIMPAIDGWYSLEITDSLGCQFTDSMRLDFLQCDSNLTANTFSPNGDGVNDKLYFKVEGGEIYKVHIYERWGSFLKEIVGSDANWDGTDEQGKMMPASTYFYVLEVDFFDGELKKFQGCISLFH